MKKGLLLFLFISISWQLSAQQKNFWLRGVIIDSANIVKNVHVVNLNKAKGTFSNDYGQYRIVASLGDTIEFTSVQYETVKKVITDPIAFSQKLNITLKKKTIVLDEIVLKEHDLTGNLLTDRKKVPKDSIAKIGKTMSEVIVELASKTTGFDEKSAEDNSSVGGIHRATDPTKKFKGVGGGIGLGSGKRKKEKLRKIISNNFSNQSVLDSIGKDYFIKLKIPEDKIISFIDYCKRFGIEKLYSENKMLELITLLEEKSAAYIEENE